MEETGQSLGHLDHALLLHVHLVYLPAHSNSMLYIILFLEFLACVKARVDCAHRIRPPTHGLHFIIGLQAWLHSGHWALTDEEDQKVSKSANALQQLTR